MIRTFVCEIIKIRSCRFYGGIDYPLTEFGLSLGRCYTEGYVIGRMVAEK